MRSLLFIAAAATVIVGCSDLTNPSNAVSCITYTPLGQGEGDQGALPSGNCTTVVGGDSLPFHDHAVILAQGARYEFSVESDGTFKPRIELRDGQTDELIAVGVQGNESGTVEELHFVSPGTGAFLIRIRPEQGSGTSGQYGILSTGCDGSDTPLTGPTFVTSTIASGDCVMRDVALTADSMIGKMDVLHVGSAGNKSLTLQTTTGGLSLDLIIVGPPGSGFEYVANDVTNSNLTVNFPTAADYLVMVGSSPYGATGGWSLSVP